MSGPWHKKPFEEVIEDVSGGNTKTPQGEFLPAGRFPVVDQGKELIAGFTNDPNRLCKAKLPVVVFGDHTRCFKFVDFPFCMGADGTKVLRPLIDADVKYLYYFLRQSHLPDEGYARHFKHLKRTEITLPPASEQRRIAAILDKAEVLRTKRQQAIALIDASAESIFVEMFGRGLNHSYTAKSIAFEDATTRITYGFTSPMGHYESGIPILTAKNITDSGFDLESVHYALASEFDALTSKCKPQRGDVLVTKDGTIGRCAAVNFDFPICINQSVALVRPNTKKVLPDYLVAFLRTSGIQRILKSMGKGNALKHLQITELAKIPLPLPEMEAQLEFLKLVRSAEALGKRHQRSREQLDALFFSLQHRAFRGEL